MVGALVARTAGTGADEPGRIVVARVQGAGVVGQPPDPRGGAHFTARARLVDGARAGVVLADLPRWSHPAGQRIRASVRSASLRVPPGRTGHQAVGVPR